MGAIAAISAILGIIGTAVGIGTSIKNAKDAEKAQNQATQAATDNLNLNKQIAQQNFDLSKEQFQYQARLNQIQMDREDTAFQRQVSDLKAAGLSPLMVAGNGASSSPLTSAQAPQFDLSGINQAMSNVIGSYNDAFNRKLQARQFALQSKVQTAQLYTDLLDAYNNTKKAKLELKYTNEKLKWEKLHGFRDLDWKSDLTKVIEDILAGRKDKDSIIPNISRESISDAVNNALNSATADDNNDFATYGSVSRNSSYGHMLDNENYNNDRDTFKLIGEELNEKKQKMDLRLKDNEKNRRELYKVDDYLSKHISLDNWLKADSKFIKYYLKNGQFEGHKKYFD